MECVVGGELIEAIVNDSSANKIIEHTVKAYFYQIPRCMRHLQILVGVTDFGFSQSWSGSRSWLAEIYIGGRVPQDPLQRHEGLVRYMIQRTHAAEEHKSLQGALHHQSFLSGKDYNLVNLCLWMMTNIREYPMNSTIKTYRGVARYFFFRSILMKSHFDTDAAEVWAKYTSKEQLSCKHSTAAPIWSQNLTLSLNIW